MTRSRVLVRAPVLVALAAALSAAPVVPVATAAGFPARAAAAVVPPGPPAHPTVEGFAPYVPPSSCDPVAKPGVVAFSRLVLGTYRDTASYGITRECSDPMLSEHQEGRAWDWRVSVTNARQVQEVNALLGWLLATDRYGNRAANARALGLMYVIWNHRLLALDALGRGWQRYCGPSPHTDHVHFSFSWAGAWQRTSFWTGRVVPTDYGPCRPAGLRWAPQRGATPPTPARCPVGAWPNAPRGASVVVANLVHWSGVTVRYGSTGPAVTAVQQRLGVTGTGWFGPVTQSHVVAFQRARRLPATGVVDVATWRALLTVSGATYGPVPAPVNNLC